MQRKRARPIRRTQAERKSATRSRVIEGTTLLIRQSGISNVTVARIVAKTGVSWGAMQNLFGTKDMILVAVCENFVATCIEKLTALDGGRYQSLADRVRAIVECTRAIYETPAFDAAAQVFRNPPQDKAAHRKLAGVLHEGRANMNRTWQHLFRDTRVDDEDLVFARHFITMALAGLAAPRDANDPIVYEWQVPYESFADRAIDSLIEYIVELLEGKHRARRRR